MTQRHAKVMREPRLSFSASQQPHDWTRGDMPRQKFCSVPGCLSTTDLIKREQQLFLAAHCARCALQRPCRCPAPDIYTTRRETRTKFASWCSAIGLRSPGYYINVCYKHFSAGCPSRACPNPDVVQPVWEKHYVRTNTMDWPAATTGPRARSVKRVRRTETTTSLLRDALMLPKANPHSSPVALTPTQATTDLSLIPIKLPQTPVPLNQLTNMATASCQPANLASARTIREESPTYKAETENPHEFMYAATPEETLVKDASSLPLLLDQSDDPYLNEGDENLLLSSPLLVQDELDGTATKWAETCLLTI